MLNYLIRFSLAQRGFILVAALVVMVFGIKTTRELPVDVLPDLTKPTVTILTEAKGYAPEEVETLITIPLENTLMGVPGVDRIRSKNEAGLSLIFVEFDWNANIDDSYQFVQQRLVGATEQLPDGIMPYMPPVTSMMGDVMLVGMRDKTGATPVRDLRETADWVVARRLQSIKGIAEVLSMGGGIKQMQIQPDPERMLLNQVSFEEIIEASSKAVGNTTGGFLTERPEEMMVRNLAMTTDPKVIGETVVAYRHDRPIRLRDVANVEWDIEPMRGDAAFGLANGQPDEDGDLSQRGIILSVRKSPGFNSLELDKEILKAIDELQKTLPENIVLIPVYRQAEFINLSMDNLKEALVVGSAMVALILFAFLLDVRITLITLTAIPLSLGITILVFSWFGMSVNSMTLGGLAVAVGMVVDDAIVDVENVFRRLKENARRHEPLPKLEVIARASAEVRSSILFATILIILVFLPLMALSGLEGKMFTPIAIATIVSMAASFLVSLTVIPVLSSFLLNPKPGKVKKEFIMVRWLKAFFRATWMRAALSAPAFVLLITIVLGSWGWVMYTKMGTNFLPPFREPTMVVATTLSPGTSLKMTTEVADTAQELLLRIPGVHSASYRAGRAEKGDHVVPVSTVEFEVEFDEDTDRDRNEIKKEIMEVMGGIKGTFSAASGPLADRLGHMLTGEPAKVAIKIYGPDLDVLKELGDQIVEVARGIPGLEQARGEQQAPISQLRIEPDPERCAAYAVAPGSITAEMASLMAGEKVGELYEGVRVYDLVVRLPAEWRENPERLENFYVDTTGHKLVPLGTVADINFAKGPNTILRENLRRRYVISINPTVDDLVSVVDQLKKEVSEKVKFPEGYSEPVYQGEYQAQKSASRTIMIMSSIILLVVIVLLYSYFRSLRFVWLVLTIIPVSLIGAIIYTGYTLNNISIATLVGFIAVAGIAARNNIMLISHYLHLMKHEGEGFTRKMVIRGTEERLVPVLMTAISAGLALIPLIVNADAPGKEILNPVAVVIVGGLVSSTLLGLAVTPAIFYHFCRKAAEKALERNAAAAE